MESVSISLYTVHRQGRARANPILLALDPAPLGPGQLQLALTWGQTGQARVGPGPALALHKLSDKIALDVVESKSNLI